MAEVSQQHNSQKDLWLSTVWLYPADFRPDFRVWLAENHHVFAEFERRALQVAARRDHYSARTIMEVIRHDSVIGELSGSWKINGNFVPDCARLFALLHPQHASLFEFREHKAAA